MGRGMERAADAAGRNTHEKFIGLGNNEVDKQEKTEAKSLPELGSQGSMSSSSLGHSAEATSRSSADCGRGDKSG